MPRKPRGVIVNAFVHVSAKGNRGVPIYLRDTDYRWFLRWLQESTARYAVRVHAYCLMGNHFHLLLAVGIHPVSKMMHALLHRYAQYVNLVNHYQGHLFGGRFWGRICTEDYDVLTVLRYIHRNPVRAGVVPRPELYPWSSHRAYLGIAREPWVSTTTLQSFSPDPRRAVAAYAQFVNDGISQTRPSEAIACTSFAME